MAILRVVLNEEVIGELFVVLTPDGDVWVKKDDLLETRLLEGLGREVVFGGKRYVSLRSIRGLGFSIDEKAASLIMEAAPEIFKPQELNAAYQKDYKVLYTRGNSAFINYSLFGDTENSAIDLSTELGIRVGDYLGTSTFNYLKTETENKGVRLLSTLRKDYIETMSTLSIGDFTATSGELGTDAVLGGVSLARNFSVSPYFIKFPPLSLGGAVETPSEVYVYVNGRLVRRESILPGKFEFENIPADVGHGVSEIVVKDAYGRETLIARPFFYSDRLLKPGLHEYSYSLGFLREGLGQESFSYGGLVLSAFHNYGFSRILKGGYMLEASKDVINMGPSASVLIMRSGVLEAALRVSMSDGKTGIGGIAGYTFQSRFFNANIALSYVSSDYRTVGSDEATDIPAVSGGSIGLSNKDLGSLSLSVLHTNFHTEPDITRYTVSYNHNILKRGGLFITASTEKTDTETENTFFAGLHYYFGGDFSGNISYEKSQGQNIEKVSIQKRLPTGTGYGFRAEAANVDGRSDFDGMAQYQNDYGIYSVGYRNEGEKNNYTASVAGGIGYIDGSAFLSRPITDSFAKVKVGDLENVRVYYFGNEIGKTDRNGEIIIPDIRSFLDNKISIENKDIPFAYSVGEFNKYVSPPYRSGSLVKFEVSKTQGFFGKIYFLKDGLKTPVEYATLKVFVEDRTLEGIVGRGGEFYIENVLPGMHPARTEFGPYICGFDIIVPASEELQVDLGETICELKKRNSL